MPFVLPPLPYARDALTPHVSAETFEFHHGKHHKAYVDKSNELVTSKGLGGASLVELIRNHKAPGDKPLFNQVAQVWNHSFFWQCLSPNKAAPTGKLAELIQRDFGSTEALLKKFSAEAVAHFASGWAWLLLDDGKLRVTSYHDADTPVAHGVAPLFTLDVWEHAYYIDYRNARAKFIDAVLGNLVNWEFVAANLDGKGASRADQKG